MSESSLKLSTVWTICAYRLKPPNRIRLKFLGWCFLQQRFLFETVIPLRKPLKNQPLKCIPDRNQPLKFKFDFWLFVSILSAQASKENCKLSEPGKMSKVSSTEHEEMFPLSEKIHPWKHHVDYTHMLITCKATDKWHPTLFLGT